MESEAPSPAVPAEEPHRSVVIYEWFRERLPKNRAGRVLLATIVAALVIGLSVGLLILPIWVDLSEDQFAGLGYGGVFVANLASTSTVFIPVPGLTVAAQALIISQGDLRNPVVVGILGGVGMGLGEITAYVAGAAGSQVARDEQIRAPKLVRPIVEGVINAVDWLMSRYGLATLFILSAIPNPTFEIAGITAGALRMIFWRFLLAVVGGSVVRGLILAFAGHYGFDLPFIT